jgi:hypothetical protein
LAQVKGAKSNEDAFMMLSDAISKETDVTKRAALGNAAFGKSWSELYPMMAQGSAGIAQAAASIPNLIDSDKIAAAQLWNNTIAEVKRNVQGFVDVIRNAVIQHLGPYILAIKDWIANNKELIKQKIEVAVQKAVEVFKKVVGVIQSAIGKVQEVISFFKEWGRVILIIGGAVGVFMGIVSAVLAIKRAVETTKAAFAVLHACIAANPIGIIVLVVAAAIAGFALLAKKVGGVIPALEVVKETFFKCVLTPVNLILEAIKFLLPLGARVGIVIAESFKAAGQAIMKCLLTPINLAIDGIKGVLTIASKLPGVGNMAKSALEAADSFQNKMNTTLTGSASTLMNSGPSFLLDPVIDAGARNSDKIAAADTWALSGISGLQGFQDKMNTALTGSTSHAFNDPANFLFDSYDSHRAEYLAKNPETAGIKTDKEESKWEELCALLKEQNLKMDEQTGAIESLADAAPGSPKALKWNKMGQEDFWGTARAGL